MTENLLAPLGWQEKKRLALRCPPVSCLLSERDSTTNNDLRSQVRASRRATPIPRSQC